MRINKPASTQTPIHELIAARWSGRAYDPSKTVDDEQLLAILEAARWAPSCFGDEPWRYLIWKKKADKKNWQRAYDCLAPGNQEWVIDAPILMLACADSVFQKNGKPNRWGQHDTGAASENICLQATALGLMAHQMGGFDSDKIRTEFNIPERYTPMAMITIGHQLDLQQLTGASKERELEPRERSPLQQRFFEGAWGQGFNVG